MNVAVGGSFAVDSLHAALTRLTRQTGLPLQVQWLLYGTLLPAAPQPGVQRLALVRVEDYMVQHPELLSKLDTHSNAAKSLVKAAKVADLEAKRAAKKRQRASGLTPAASPSPPAGAAADADDDAELAGPAMPSVLDVLTAATAAPSWEAAQPLVHGALTSLLGALLHTAGGDTGGADRSLTRHIPQAAAAASAPPAAWLWFLPPSPFATSGDPRCAGLLQGAEVVVEACLGALRNMGPHSATHGAITATATANLDLTPLPTSWTGGATLDVVMEGGDTAPPLPSFSLDLPLTFWRGAPEDQARAALRAAAHVAVQGSAALMRACPSQLPMSQWFAATTALATHNPLSHRMWGQVAYCLGRRMHQAHAVPQKVLVLDCDNTLWGGVVGEVGAAGLDMTGPFAALQAAAADAKARGMLLVLASRNEEHDVRSVFRERAEDMRLAEADIAYWGVNWDAKSVTLRRAATALGVALDSFLFLDDNPLEVAEVNAAVGDGVGGATAILLPPDRSTWGAFLRHLWPLHVAQGGTSEDAARTQLYAERAARQAALGAAGSFAAFLASLNVRMEVEVDVPGTAARVAQLTGRTNQMNVCKRPYSEGEVRGMMEDRAWRVLATTVTDRFGCYGLVCVGIAATEPFTIPDATTPPPDPHGAGGGAVQQDFKAGDSLTVGGVQYTLSTHPAGASVLVVRTFLMSCRVLHRGTEHAMLRRLGQMAADVGAEFVAIKWIPSDRNEPARRFLFGAAGENALFVPCEATTAPVAAPGGVETGEGAEDHKGGLPWQISAKPPQGWLYIPTQHALQVRLVAEDVDVEEVYGPHSADAKNAVSAKAAATEVLAGGPSTDTAATGSPDAPVPLAVDSASGIKLSHSVYSALASGWGGGAEGEADAHSSVPSSLGGLWDSIDEEDAAVASAAGAAMADTLAKFTQVGRTDVSADEAASAFMAQRLHERQSKFRRKMRLQAKVVARAQLEGGGPVEGAGGV